ncbi:MAG: PhzF family phenazine biosynthesis protein [Myxococcales bacterium]|nr:PhzF family phenazine biosynthesis protein [Myxococcales bacterium]
MPVLPFYQLDAFSERAFGGNPAAVCPLEKWLPDEQLQAIAAENNLSETAFFVPEDDDTYALRWFTPTTEVELCGHATLAAGYVVLYRLRKGETVARFTTRKAGPLTVTRVSGGRLELALPARAPRPADPPEGLTEALGGAKVETCWRARDLLVVLADAEAVRALKPDMRALAALDEYAVCVTAPGTGADGDVDFVSRFFAPKAGVDEDPVTGSAHCTLVPFWTRRLGKNPLRARQVSARSGDLEGDLQDDRVLLRGHATLVIEGHLRF